MILLEFHLQEVTMLLKTNVKPRHKWVGSVSRERLCNKMITVTYHSP